MIELVESSCEKARKHPIKSWLYPLLAAIVLFSPVIVKVWLDDRKPMIEPDIYMGDRVVRIEVTPSNEFIFTSRDGKIIKTSDFKNYKWIQR